MSALVLAPTASAAPAPTGDDAIFGTVAGQDGQPVAEVNVDVFQALPTGGKGRWYGSTATDRAGGYTLFALDGCYIVELTAPAGDRFVRVGSVRRQTVCVDNGQAEHPVDAVVATVVASASGMVRDLEGRAVALVAVDLLQIDESSGGVHQVFSTATDSEGHYGIGVPRAGCYQVRLSAPTGSTFSRGGRRAVGLPFCAGSGDVVTGLDATVATAATASITGRAVDTEAGAVVGITARLHLLTGDGTAGPVIAEATTGPSGWYVIDVEPGCYVTALAVPDDRLFVEGGQEQHFITCVTDGERRHVADGVIVSHDDTAPPALSAIEWEIVRLTNALRADPDGPLARQEALPGCVDEEFFAIEVDPTTGRPQPTPPLEVDLDISAGLAQAWAAELSARGGLAHRPSEDQVAVYDQVGLDVDSWGENLAWASGVRADRLARFHFESLRESDESHYCALVTGRFTHIGVGELTVESESWAVQNFYRLGS